MQSRSAHPTAASCWVVAYAGLQFDLEAIRALRAHPPAVRGRKLTPAALKYVDDQTLVSLATVLHTAELLPQGLEFTDWTLVAAPRFLGRVPVTGIINGFYRQGVSQVHPLIIPQQSLHAVSGMLSISLKCHGPNLGVGGGREAVLEGLWAGLVKSQTTHSPGIWVVTTDWSPEAISDDAGRHGSPAAVCRSAAFALSPRLSTEGGLSGSSTPVLRLSLRLTDTTATAPGTRSWPDVGNLHQFFATLSQSATPLAWEAALPGVGVLTLEGQAHPMSLPMDPTESRLKRAG